MKILQIIFGTISLFFGVFALVFIIVFPLAGIYFDYNCTGTSMEPAFINAVDLRLGPEWVPYEDLQVGDIIVFTQEDYQESKRPPGKTYTLVWNKDQTKLRLNPETELEEVPLKYIRVRHRIIDINENGLITKGDNNEGRDLFPVRREDYQGKIVWHMNHINWLFKAMYQYGFWSGCLILFLMIHCVWREKKGALYEK